MHSKASFALGAVISGAITLLMVSPFLSVRMAQSSTASHTFETLLLVPGWCSSTLRETATLALHPLDVADNWDAGVKYIGIASGSVEDRERASQMVLSKCYGQTITLSGGNQESLVANELREMKARGDFGHILVNVKSDEVILQVGRNVGH